MIKRSIFFMTLYLMIVMRITLSQANSEATIKIFNTENIILTMKDIKDYNHDDLEVVESNVLNDSELNKKLEDFHKFIHNLRTSEKPESFYTKPLNHESFVENEIKRPPLKVRKRKKMKWLKQLKKRKHFWKNRWMNHKRQIVFTIANYHDYAELDMNNLQKEYEEFVIETRKNNKSFMYTNKGKPEEGIRDVIATLLDFKIPSNCTNVSGIGIQAIECIMQRKNAKIITLQETCVRIFCILLCWFCIYLAVAIPLWCFKGWCFCCFQCWFCFPQRTVNEIQKYVQENPPGVLVNSKGERECYDPTMKETELYGKIQRDIAEYYSQ